LINIICDHALLTGYASGVKMIDANVIKECEKELHIPIDTKKREGQQEPPLKKSVVAGATATREEPSSKKSILWILLIILLVSGGYFFYYLNLEDSPSFKMEDIAPQKYDSPALREKEAFVPGVSDQKKAPAAQSVQTPSRPETAEIAKTPETTAAPATAANQDSAQNEVIQKSETPAPAPARKTLLYFKHNSNDLEDKAFETLDQIADYVIENPGLNVSVEGYTDSSGSHSYNISVSQFRANTIKSYLVGKGVNPSRIAAKGLGPESPIATNNTETGRTKNRRVEIKLDN
jgi:general secretion pathway protein A